MSEAVGVFEERFDELWDICAMKFREGESRKKSDIIDIAVIEECDNVEEVAHA